MNDPRDDDSAARVIMSGGGVSQHDAFVRDVLRLLENSEISDEDRQRVLSNMACPCCGGAASIAVPLTRTKD